MRPDVDRAIRRAQSYWYEDGLTEIAVGCVFGLIGLLFLAESFLPAGVLPPGFSALALPILVVGGGLLARHVVNAVKARITYPRTGRVTYHRPPRRSKAAAGVIAAVLAALSALLLVAAPAPLTWLPALQGLIVGGAFLYVGYRLAVARFYVLGLLSLLIGLGASLGGLGDPLGSAVYFCATGAVVVISGVLALLAYLHRNRPPVEEV
mgnify:CR=1 FL=1